MQETVDGDKKNTKSAIDPSCNWLVFKWLHKDTLRNTSIKLKQNNTYLSHNITSILVSIIWTSKVPHKYSNIVYTGSPRKKSRLEIWKDRTTNLETDK